MSSQLRHRPNTLRSKSSILAPTESEDSDFERAPHRPRSFSLHHSQSQPSSPTIESSSSLLNSLDLSGSISSLRSYFLGKLALAEDNLEELRQWYEDETDQAEDTQHDEDDDEDDEEDDEVEWELVTRKKGRRVASPPPASPRSRKSKSSRSPSATAEDETSAVESFIKTASGFLSALRAELPSLSLPASPPASANPLVQFHLSPEARLALDHFLEDHPLPSFPQLDLRARFDSTSSRASDSASALLCRVSVELSALQQVLTHLTQLSPGSEGLSSYMSALPSTPVPPLSALRDYFSAESDRLSTSLSEKLQPAKQSMRNLKHEASAGLAALREEAAELGSIAFEGLSSGAAAGLDEAAKLYHKAVEFGRTRLLEYHELPPDWRNNEHILSGYRYITIDRWGVLLRSAFEWHNETINVQTHLIGFLSLVWLTFYILPGSPHYLPDSHWADTAIALLFIGAAMKCLLCSTAWHLLSGCASHDWFRGAACVDYVGISGLIGASVMSMEYYSWYCRPQLAVGYMIFSGSLALVGMYLPWKPYFNMRSFKMWRIAFFLSLAASAIVPIAHAAYAFGVGRTFAFYAPVIPSVAAYLFGLTFYARQFPECAAPGYFDSLLASHQVWHASIVLAVWMHWRAITTMAAQAGAGTDLSCAVI